MLRQNNTKRQYVKIYTILYDLMLHSQVPFTFRDSMPTNQLPIFCGIGKTWLAPDLIDKSGEIAAAEANISLSKLLNQQEYASTIYKYFVKN